MDMGARHRVTIVAAAVAVGALLLAACGDDEDAAGDTTADTSTDTTAEPAAGDDLQDELDGREFVSSDVEGRELAAGSEIRLSFQGDQISISAGCNTMGGTYTVDDGVLRADQLFTTEMACEEPLMDQDTWMTGFLAAGSEATLDGDTLTLTGDEVTITLLDREVAEPDLPLEGTTWAVDGLVSADAVSSMLAGTNATLLVEGDTVSVDAGCNTGSGAAEVDAEAGTITFGPIATTRMACEPEVMDQEGTILAVLDGEVTYEIESNHLSLTNVADPTLGLTLTTTS
jgi:heat shock protein HslJ